jgi:hypothetical protein
LPVPISLVHIFQNLSIRILQIFSLCEDNARRKWLEITSNINEDSFENPEQFASVLLNMISEFRRMECKIDWKIMDSLVNDSISCLLPATKANSDHSSARSSRLAECFAEIVLVVTAPNSKIPSFYKGLFEKGRKLGRTFSSSNKDPVCLGEQISNSTSAEDAVVNQVPLFCECLAFGFVSL